MEKPVMLPKNIEKNTPLPTQLEAETFLAAGYDVDSEGRPLHPNLNIMQPSTPTGRGAYWNWGPNFTADPIVVTSENRPRVLLIERSDTGDLALPGGFVDANELNTPMQAAYRELEEETGLRIESEGTLVYQGIVDDPRATAHAWPETSAYLFIVPEPLPVQAGDDAREACWHYVDELPITLYGSHAKLIKKALEIHTTSRRTIEEVLAVPTEERETQHIDAGHMAYDHFFTRHQDDHLFVKAHNSARFTDTIREAHSRAYLQKEYSLFHHLEQQHFSFIPQRVALMGDTVLAMDALHQDNGWVWRAPRQREIFKKYTTDTIEAFNSLQNITPPVCPEYHASIQNTYTTLWQEGWDSITDEILEKISSKIQAFSNNWSAEQSCLGKNLISTLPAIKERAMSFSRDEALFMAHNDARQSNIAWHPAHGTRLVDWSWGDVAPRNADTTMFLIDLAKSGKNVDTHLSLFNQDYAHILIGFWLAHSLWDTRDGSQTVREHQVASAIAAYQLITKEH